MVFTIVLGLSIACYAGFVIHRRLKDVRQGKYCGCGCRDCTQKCPSDKK